MIYEIGTLEEAQENLTKAYKADWDEFYQMFRPLVFVLDESLDPNEVEVKIRQCDTCDICVHYKLGDGDVSDRCPRCRENALRTMVKVFIVIQGDRVVLSDWE